MKNCEITYKAWSNLMQHLTKGAHHFSNKDANDIADGVESYMYILVDYKISSKGKGGGDISLREVTNIN
jgi:hypothetical protein